MLSAAIRRKLESIRELPSIPFIMSEVLHSVDDENMRASRLASLIERDQSLTARVLRVANSPFYGFVRRISTIELAIVMLGMNTIKEIVIGIVLNKFYNRIRRSALDTKAFWQYSVFSGACSRLLARKLDYRLAGEAFVAGLMHDIGILIISEHFTQQYFMINIAQEKYLMPFVEAEKKILNCTHTDIGAWFAERWNLPEKLCDAIRYHHSSAEEIDELIAKMTKQSKAAAKPAPKSNSKSTSKIPAAPKKVEQVKIPDSEQPLTKIIALSEWFASKMGFKEWAHESRQSTLYMKDETLEEITEHDVYSSAGALELIKQEIADEYARASEFNKSPSVSLYK